MTEEEYTIALQNLDNSNIEDHRKDYVTYATNAENLRLQPVTTKDMPQCYFNAIIAASELCATSEPQNA